jgi:2-furoate---CoA ligase
MLIASEEPLPETASERPPRRPRHQYLSSPDHVDLGRTLLAVVERSPDALAIVDGERRLSYAAWYREIGRVGGGLAALGLSRRERLAVILQNRLEMATLHWACQFVGSS